MVANGIERCENCNGYTSLESLRIYNLLREGIKENTKLLNETKDPEMSEHYKEIILINQENLENTHTCQCEG